MYFVLIEHIITRVSGTQLPPLYTRRYIIFTRIPRRYIFPFSFSLQRCTYFSPSVRVRQYVRIYNVFFFSFFCQPFILRIIHRFICYYYAHTIFRQIRFEILFASIDTGIK